MNVAIIGIVGVPANYGGFETLVENIIGDNCSDNINYTVFCSSVNCDEKLVIYKNATLEYIPLKANGAQSLFYDIYSLVKASFHCDVMLILGVSGCLFLPFFRVFCKKKVIVNIDGIEHKRNKWGKIAKCFLKCSELFAVKYADVVISDNKGIQDYVTKEYSIDSEMIAYGGDHVLCSVSEEREAELLSKYDLRSGEYSFSVCRIEPENNVHIALEAFEKIKKCLVFVGNWEANEYGKKLLNTYRDTPNIILLSAIYELEVLNVLRSNCEFYIHGHSAGGTNPSLVEAMFFAKPILAFDVVYNRETTEHKASYFSNTQELCSLLSKSCTNYNKSAESMYEIANRCYRWAVIAKQYETKY